MYLWAYGKSQISNIPGVNYSASKTETLKLELWCDRKHHNLNSTYSKPHGFQGQVLNLQPGKSTLKIAEPGSESLIIKPDVDLKSHVTSQANHVDKNYASLKDKKFT